MSEQRKIGPFILDSELGRGGMGTVWLATYVKTGQKVALQELADSFSRRITRSPGASSGRWRSCRSSAIRTSSGITAGSRPGRSSSTPWNWHRRHQSMTRSAGRSSSPGRRAIDYGIQLAKALEHAHGHNVVHRDLKPGNLLLNEKGSSS